MPLYCSITGSTALRDAEVQQPMIAAILSLTRSFLAFSANVGQSLAPSSWMNLILRPSTPPAALICSIASFSAWIEPVSEIAIVPVAECRMPTVTSVSVTASPVVLTAEVAGTSAKDGRGSMASAGSAAAPINSLRRNGDFRPRSISSDMRTPFVLLGSWTAWSAGRMARFVHCTDTQDCVYCTAKARRRLCVWNDGGGATWRQNRSGSGVHSGRAAADRPRQAPVQSVGCQPDAGRLRAALHRQECAALVRCPRRQHRAGRDLVPGAGGDRRHDHAELWRHQRHRRHSGR